VLKKRIVFLTLLAEHPRDAEDNPPMRACGDLRWSRFRNFTLKRTLTEEGVSGADAVLGCGIGATLGKMSKVIQTSALN